MDAVQPDELPVGLVRLDADERILEVNRWFAEWVDRPASALRGVHITDLLPPVEDDLMSLNDGVGPFIMRHPNSAGRAVMVARSVDSHGVLLTVVEATERYRALRDLRRSHALADRTQIRLQLIIDASIAFASATTEERLAEVLADTAARAYTAEDSVVMLLDERGSLRTAAGVHPLIEFFELSEAAEYARQMHDVLTVSGLEEAQFYPGLPDAMSATGIHAIISAPLDHEGETYGVFACFFRHQRTFDQEAAPLAEALAGQAAQALVTLRLQSRLEHAAMHDETTGLPNRRLLEERMRDQVIGERRGRAVVFLDLDGFKSVNDALGHAVGDEVLREVGRRLQSSVRDGDIVARYGGDEFIVVCNVADAADAEEIAERLRSSIRVQFDFLPDGLTLGASVGVALAPIDDDRVTLDGIIRAADHAMYLAKSRGGDRVVSNQRV